MEAYYNELSFNSHWYEPYPYCWPHCRGCQLKIEINSNVIIYIASRRRGGGGGGAVSTPTACLLYITYLLQLQ